MRRIALPLSLLTFACTSETTPATTTDAGSESSDGGSSSSASSEPTATNPATSEVDSSGSMTDPSTGSSEEATTNPETTDPDTGPDSVCGDGMIEGNEVCEGTDFGANTCATQGFMQGELVCAGDCLGFDTAGCYICGNDNIEGPEECDGVLGNNVDCESAGFTEGDISCVQATCMLDVSLCTLCGDGTAEGAESCDGADFAGETCETIGFTGGTLDCDAEECGLIITSCTGGAWSTGFESGTFESEFYFSGDADWIIDAEILLTGSFSAHSGDLAMAETSVMRLDTGFSAAGTVAFQHRESTQQYYDIVEFRVDGALQGSWSGLTSLQNASYPVTAGNHTLEWRYTKNNFGVGAAGNDAVYVDQIALTNGVALMP